MCRSDETNAAVAAVSGVSAIATAIVVYRDPYNVCVPYSDVQNVHFSHFVWYKM